MSASQCWYFLEAMLVHLVLAQPIFSNRSEPVSCAVEHKESRQGIHGDREKDRHCTSCIKDCHQLLLLKFLVVVYGNRKLQRGTQLTEMEPEQIPSCHDKRLSWKEERCGCDENSDETRCSITNGFQDQNSGKQVARTTCI